MEQHYDVIVIGGGHNGLVNAAYLAKAGKKVVVLERRHVLGGAAVTEEIIPGFLFSEWSYVVSLLLPQIIRELDLPPHRLETPAPSLPYARPATPTSSPFTTWAKPTALSAPGASAAAGRAPFPTPSPMPPAKPALKSASKRPLAKSSSRMAALAASPFRMGKNSSPTPFLPASTRTSPSKNFSNPANSLLIFSKASAVTNFAALPAKSILPSTRFPISNVSLARAPIFGARSLFRRAWNTWSALTTTPSTATTRAVLTLIWSFPASPTPASRLPANTCSPALCNTRPTNLPKVLGTIKKKPSAKMSSTPSPNTPPTSKTSSSAVRF